MEPEISLSCKDLVKTYPGVIAMDHINFELRKGEVHACSEKTAQANPRR